MKGGGGGEIRPVLRRWRLISSSSSKIQWIMQMRICREDWRQRKSSVPVAANCSLWEIERVLNENESKVRSLALPHLLLKKLKSGFVFRQALKVCPFSSFRDAYPEGDSRGEERWNSWRRRRKKCQCTFCIFSLLFCTFFLLLLLLALLLALFVAFFPFISLWLSIVSPSFFFISSSSSFFIVRHFAVKKVSVLCAIFKIRRSVLLNWSE